MVAGVYSRCMLEDDNNSMKDCCQDPVIYERVNEEIKRWIWKTAPGVRESVGCPKKEIIGMMYDLPKLMLSSYHQQW